MRAAITSTIGCSQRSCVNVLWKCLRRGLRAKPSHVSRTCWDRKRVLFVLIRAVKHPLSQLSFRSAPCLPRHHLWSGPWPVIVAWRWHLFERCRACFSLADFFSWNVLSLRLLCYSLVAFLLGSCGFLAAALRAHFHPNSFRDRFLCMLKV